MLSQVTDIRVARAGEPQEEPPVIYVVDDDVSVREALEALIERAGWRAQIFDSGEAFLRQARGSCPSCLLLDFALPDLNGLQIQQRIAAERPEISIIFITARGDVLTTVRAMRAGAVEFLLKPFDSQALLEAIRLALLHSRAVLRRVQRESAFERAYASLSPRERQVMHLVVRGLLNKQVGCELNISEITVKAHRGRVMQKMRAHSLAQLVTMVADAQRAGALTD
jgi:FixJ family two-component response regulator